MLLQRKERLPEGPDWLYEIKLDGYRALAIKNDGRAALRSRNDNDFSRRYPTIVEALAALPNQTVIDGEVVALDETGKPSFNVLQNCGSSPAAVFYYVFDLLVLASRNVMGEPLAARRALLEKRILPKLRDPLRYSVELKASLPDLIASVKAQGLEGLFAKKRSGIYESGLYAGRTRNGFTPPLRAELMKRLRSLQTDACPFENLPEKRRGRWGQGLTASKMKECRWLRPALVAQFEFVEWAGDLHLRHTSFIALRDDKKAKDVTREKPCTVPPVSSMRCLQPSLLSSAELGIRQAHPYA